MTVVFVICVWARRLSGLQLALLRRVLSYVAQWWIVLFRTGMLAPGRNFAVERLNLLPHAFNLGRVLLLLLLLPLLPSFCFDEPLQMQPLAAQFVFRSLLLPRRLIQGPARHIQTRGNLSRANILLLLFVRLVLAPLVAIIVIPGRIPPVVALLRGGSAVAAVIGTAAGAPFAPILPISLTPTIPPITAAQNLRLHHRCLGLPLKIHSILFAIGKGLAAAL